MPQAKSETVNTLGMFNPFTAAMPEAVKRFGAMQGRLMSACLRSNLDYLEFLKRRVEKDISLVEEVSAQDEPSEMISACAEFWRVAYSDYSEELGRLAAVGSELVNEASGEAGRQAEAVREEILRDRSEMQEAA